MPGWLRRALYAAQLAADRADLWPAGALAWLAFLGWLPFLLVVARPDPDDLASIGVSIYTSGAYPLNLIGLAALAVVLFALLCLLSAAAQVGLLRSAAAADPAQPPLPRAMLTGFTIVLLAAVPVVAALVAVLAGGAAVAPDAFQSPDTATPILVRLAAPLVPLLIVLVVALLAGQAFGGTALRIAHASPGDPFITLLGRSFGALRHPWRVAGVVLGGLLLDVLVLVVTTALLSVLWMPIGEALAAGRLATPETILLLLGFVAIWLGLLLVAGAVQVAVSAWWAIEEARRGRDVARRRDLPPLEDTPPIGTRSGGAP